jgi:hypothetical protein
MRQAISLCSKGCGQGFVPGQLEAKQVHERRCKGTSPKRRATLYSRDVFPVEVEEVVLTAGKPITELWRNALAIGGDIKLED